MSAVEQTQNIRAFGYLPPYTQFNPAGVSRFKRAAAIIAFFLFCLIYGFFFALFAPLQITVFFAPVIFLALLVVWALPGMLGAPTQMVRSFFYAFFISLVIWPNYLAIALPGLPWITLARLTGFPLLFLLLLCVSVSREFREKMRVALGALPVLWKSLAALVVIQLISVFLSYDPAQSIDKFVAAQVSWTAIFFVACFFFLKPGSVEMWAKCLWAMAILLGIIGLIEYSRSRVPWADHIPSFLKIDDESVIRILRGGSRSATGEYRISSTFGTPLGLAEYLALTVPFVLHFAASRHQKFSARLAAIISLPFMFYTVILTDSRLGVVGFFLTILLYPLIWAAIEWRHKRGSIIAPAVVLAYPIIICSAVAATFFVGRVHALMWGNGPQAASNASRMEQYRKGLSIVLTHPLGQGIGMGAHSLGFVSPSGILTIDTYYLLIALEYGIAGFLIYYSMILLSIYHAAKNSFEISTLGREYSLFVPITISLINFFVIKSIFSQQDNHSLIFMMMGALVALVSRGVKSAK